MYARRESDQPVLTILKDFASKTSAHGVKYTGSDNNGLFRKLLWLLAVLMTGGYLISQLISVFVNYNRYPFQTVNKMIPTFSLPFPTVTLCDLNSIDSTKIQNNSHEVTEVLRLFQSEWALVMNKTVEDLQDTEPYRSILARSYAELNVEGAPDIESSIIYCSWDGVTENCKKMLVYVDTTVGRCFQMNGDASRVSQHAGAQSGFFLIVRVNPDGYIVSDKNALGYKVLIHQSVDYVDMNFRGLLLSPGLSYDISFNKYTHKYLPEPHKSLGVDCMYPSSQSDLPDFGEYSLTRCIVGHCMKKAADLCGCSNDNCSVKDFLGCYVPNFDSAYARAIKGDRFGFPLLCVTSSYVPIISHARFPAPGFRDIMHKLAPEFSKDVNDSRETLIAIHLHFEDMIVRELEHVPEYTMHSVMGVIGGNMGLFLGASLLTVAEFVELMFNLLRRAVQRLVSFITSRLSVTQDEARCRHHMGREVRCDDPVTTQAA